MLYFLNNIRSLNQRETLGGLDNFLSRKILLQANTDANVVIQSHSVRNRRKDLFCFLLNGNCATPENKQSQHLASVLHAISVLGEDLEMVRNEPVFC